MLLLANRSTSNYIVRYRTKGWIMLFSRRLLLGASGATLSLLPLGRSGQILRAQPADPAAAWGAALASADRDPRIRALGWAVLAPNPHNRQPWIAELPGGAPDTVVLRCDLDRRLPVTDPFDRQIVIGLGAFCELFVQAAGEEGRAVTVVPFPEGEPAPRLDARPVALLRLGAPGTASPDPLFRHAAARRSNKQPFDANRPVAPAALDALRDAAMPRGALRFAADAARVTALRDLAWRGMETEGRTRPAWMESVALIRIGEAEVAANPDGISLRGPRIEAARAAGQLTRESLADVDGPGFAQMGAQYRAVIATAMAFAWIVTPGDSRAEQLATGRDWVRLNLAATGAGIALHPLSQVLQEFPQMAALYAEAHRALTPEGGRVQMLGRLGYGAAVPPTPRWPAATRIRAA
jgi:hypothetical protein